MARAKVVLLTGAIMMALVFTSCATALVKRVPPRPIQLMAEEGTIVIAVDAVRERELVALAFDGMEELGGRSRRVSLALQGKGDGYPMAFDDVSMWAVIEGDYPSFLVNTALMYVPALRRHEVEGGPTWFSHKTTPLSLRAVGKDTILLTDGDYETAYRRYKGGGVLLDSETARVMEHASIGIYALRPKTFFDLGLDLPQSVFEQAETVLLLLDDDGEEGYLADAIITMQSEKGASTLSQMVRSGYIARLRKEGKAVNIAALRQMFLLEGDQVTIHRMEVPGEQLSELKNHLVGII
ncbi:MAG: hypothetical protein M0Q37_10325 [Sphaerochaeta sp.]|nr:hypothetical protein [Sphaerochaeta sp.]